MKHKVNPSSPLVSAYMIKNKQKLLLEKLGKYNLHLKKEIFLGSSDKKYYPPSALYIGGKIGLPVPSNTFPQKEYVAKTKLRDYQQEVFDDIKDEKSGLILLQTGGGKSVIASELCNYWGGKALIVVHSQDMINQFAETFKTFCGIECGEYYSKKKELSEITLTTFASATQKQELFGEHGFDNLIIDECDIFLSDKQRNFVCSFDSERKIGMTGTLQTKLDIGSKRDVLPLFWGKVATSDVTFTSPLETIAYTVFRDQDAPTFNGNWHEMREWIDNSKERLQKIMWDMDVVYKEGDSLLLLLDRVDHVNWIHGALVGLFPVVKLHGKMKASDREASIETFKTKKGIMVAQYKTAGRGFDVPLCNKIYIGFPNKQESGLRQMIGRVLRPIEGKKSFVIDLVDSNLWFQFHERKKVYKEFFNLEPREF